MIWSLPCPQFRPPPLCLIIFRRCRTRASSSGWSTRCRRSCCRFSAPRSAEWRISSKFASGRAAARFSATLPALRTRALDDVFDALHPEAFKTCFVEWAAALRAAARPDLAALCAGRVFRQPSRQRRGRQTLEDARQLGRATFKSAFGQDVALPISFRGLAQLDALGKER
jgi:hypothetical protein